MFYLIGIGLDEESISEKDKKIISLCDKVYLENYTVDFPYSFEKLEENIGKKIIKLEREEVEDNHLIQEAKKQEVALLIYGSPLSATTHISLIQEAKKQEVDYEIRYNGSIFDAIGETGLEIYKFGKVTSIPKWKTSFKPTSFMEIVKQNQNIDAHSLLLIDINLELQDALNELKLASEEYKIQLDKIIVCSSLGTKKSKIFYNSLNKIEGLNISKPYCFIIPSKLHFIEQEFLNNF
jgi:diphthine synthase